MGGDDPGMCAGGWGGGGGEAQAGPRQVQLVLVCMWLSGDLGGPGRGPGTCRVKGRIGRIS